MRAIAMILELWVAQSCAASSPSESQDGERMGRQDVSKEKAGKFCKSLVFSWQADKINFCQF